MGKEEKEIKEQLKDLEFNNAEEDKEIIEEKKEPKNDNNKSKLIIILLSVVIGLLLIVLVVLLTGNKGEDKKDDSGSGGKDTPEEKKEFKETAIAGAKLYFDKYIVSINEDKTVILDITGNEITSLDITWSLNTSNDKELLFINHNKGTITVKKTIDGEIVEIFNGEATGLIRDYSNNNVFGLYKTDGNHDLLYLFDGKTYDTIDLKNLSFYTFSIAEGSDKYVYNGKYIVTAKLSNNKLLDFGIYDIKDKKQLVDGEYDGLEYLTGDNFVAIKGDKSGVINTSNKVLLEINYKAISYSNGLYFVGSNKTLEVYNDSLVGLHTYIDVAKLDSFSYHLCCGNINPYKLIAFKDNVVIGTLENDNTYRYAIIKKNGDAKEIGPGNVTVIDNYLVFSSTENTNIVMYDNDLKVKHTLDAKETNIDLSNSYIFINNLLSIDAKKFFNLDNDTDKGLITTVRRSYQGYEVKIVFGNNGKGILTISKDDVVLKELENVSVNEFFKADNNGIKVTKDYFIYNAGAVVILRNLQSATSALNNLINSL